MEQADAPPSEVAWVADLTFATWHPAQPWSRRIRGFRGKFRRYRLLPNVRLLR